MGRHRRGGEAHGTSLLRRREIDQRKLHPALRRGLRKLYGNDGNNRGTDEVGTEVGSETPARDAADDPGGTPRKTGGEKACRGDDARRRDRRTHLRDEEEERGDSHLPSARQE